MFHEVSKPLFGLISYFYRDIKKINKVVNKQIKNIKKITIILHYNYSFQFEDYIIQ